MSEPDGDWTRTLSMRLPVPPAISDLPEDTRAIEAAGLLMQYAGKMVHAKGISPRDRMQAFSFALGWIAATDDLACDACEAVGVFLRSAVGVPEGGRGE